MKITKKIIIAVLCFMVLVVGLLFRNSHASDTLLNDGLYTFPHTSYYAYGYGEQPGVDIELITVHKGKPDDTFTNYANPRFICDDGSSLGTSFPADSPNAFPNSYGNISEQTAFFIINGMAIGEKKNITALEYTDSAGKECRLELGNIEIECVAADPEISPRIYARRYSWNTCVSPVMEDEDFCIDNYTDLDFEILGFGYGNAGIETRFREKAIQVAGGQSLEVTIPVEMNPIDDQTPHIYVLKPKFTFSSKGIVNEGVFLQKSYKFYVPDTADNIISYFILNEIKEHI